MSTTSPDQTPLDELRVGETANFVEGPPLELFRRLRAECPVHWTDGFSEYPDEDGFWSVTTADDVARGQSRLADVLLRSSAASRP